MLAVTRTQYGAPEILEVKEIDKPVPKKGEVLIRVRATTVNRTDCGILLGKPGVIRAFTGLITPTDLVPGTDFAGEVEAIGPGVTKFNEGDKVWGFNDNGISSWAEYMLIKEDGKLTKIPENSSFKEIVACIEGAHYALNFINKVKVKTKDKVLINGATGAIGSAMLQILVHMGLEVTAVGNTKNLILLESLGANKVINYEAEDFTKLPEGSFDFVFDAVGKSRFSVCEHLLKPKGVYISSELGEGLENTYLPLLTKIKGGKRVKFPFPTDIKGSLNYISKLVEQGAFKPIIDRTYSIEDIRQAYTYVLSGEKTGNVVVEI
ncbi:NAD(P)-dependent alcohol dehydrogenase [Fulvivirga lutimaris]|uniref:NAD(P)-dependent alcohol dehydrogenase n=1 Tax=Fulvivirga lutimaris TaxID=1819566 RepID=UPI0012BBBE1D|nr:NAD(P)-dependent alcohol dehydrogenase [Fulvivirga lutimaris]MTI38162.1 NAD(P)-dependent alcohol dehydrogenase [Fulvivirga lutimaris]